MSRKTAREVAMKLAFADIYKYVGDPRSMDITPEQMLDDSYLAERARLIDPARASQPGMSMWLNT
mgnify:CR=1 FL=1